LASNLFFRVGLRMASAEIVQKLVEIRFKK
jgi:hypothetical protein